MTVLWTDVSKHDWNRRGGPLDWSKILPATSRCMCARLTYGDPQGYNPSSPYGVEMVRAAKTAGADLRGGYHNLIKGDQASINRQVDYLRREMDRAGANWGMLDVERYKELLDNGLYPRWDDVRQFDDRWAAVEDRVLAQYLAEWVWVALGKPDLRVLRGPLINANYPLGTTADDPADLYRRCGGNTGTGWDPFGGRTPDGWQYSARAVVPGASSQTDVNAYRGTFAQLQALLTPQQEDDMTPTEHQLLEGAAWRMDALMFGSDTVRGGPTKGETMWTVKKLKELTTRVDELAATPPGTVVITDEQLERVLRKVVGSVDQIPPS